MNVTLLSLGKYFYAHSIQYSHSPLTYSGSFWFFCVDSLLRKDIDMNWSNLFENLVWLFCGLCGISMMLMVFTGLIELFLAIAFILASLALICAMIELVIEW